jgi:hypothetical protein
MPDLSNDNLWHPVYEGSTTLSGEPSKGNKIPAISFPIPFINQFFRCYVQTSNPNYYYGGIVILNIGSVSAASPIYATSRKLVLKKWRLLEFPLIEQGGVNSQFHLVYDPPWWFTDVNLAIYQYQE